MKHTLLLAPLVLASAAHAHFKMITPVPMYQQGGLGDPQKAPPCGADGTEVPSDAGVPTYAPGQVITITINEEVPHPGHYRVSLGETGPASLPAEPAVTPGAQACGTAAIMSPAVYPVLADDQLDHTAAFTTPQSFTVTMPNVSCTNCTLQVIEFMSAHGLNNPGGCFYHHCATINIAGSSGAGGGSAGTGGGTSATGGGTAAAGGGSTATGGASGAGGGTVATGGTSAAGGASSTGGASGTGGGTATGGGTGAGDISNIGGCASTGGGEAAALLALAALAMLGLRRRRS